MPSIKQYSHLSRQKQQSGKAWLRMLLVLIGLWCLAVLTWSTDRVAVLFGYHPDLGAPLFQIQDHAFYWPWKLFDWSSRFAWQEEVGRCVDQAYLARIGLPLLGFMLYKAVQQGLKGCDDLHGSGLWAAFKDIDAMGYLKGECVYVGGFWEPKKRIHYYLRHNGPEHVLCFAPTRSGKGVGLILPTLLSWPHSSLVFDIKGENVALTSGYLKSQGHKVLRFDPSDADGTSAAFNQLAEVRLYSAMSSPDVQQIASMVMDPNGKGLEDYRGKAAFGFFGGALLHCLIKTQHEQGRPANLYDVAVLLEGPHRPVKEVFDEMWPGIQMGPNGRKSSVSAASGGFCNFVDGCQLLMGGHGTSWIRLQTSSFRSTLRS
ncbi:MAG: type IV secretory system conjugative DNA transfer family protein [Deltaproteobacteria bacterium]|jgi:type IV secretion system protein VirD4|nr:type IV secretory system conjugative DNA transfer family protein [Deltaproteobacteria bacterium]